jgi:outer membrane protein
MKKTLTLLTLTLALGLASASAESLKVGTVDMQKVFKEYYKTKTAETRIGTIRESAKKEFDEKVDHLNKGAAEVKKMAEDAERPELSKESKESKVRARDEKIAELRAEEKDLNDFKTTRERDIQKTMSSMLGDIVKEINAVIADKVAADNYHVVLDKSGPSTNGVPVVLFARPEFDFTDAVIAVLNKNRSKEEAAAPAVPSTTPEKTVPAATPKKK